MSVKIWANLQIKFAVETYLAEGLALAGGVCPAGTRKIAVTERGVEQIRFLGLEAAVIMESFILWDINLCLLPASCRLLAWLIPQDEGNIFLRNVGWIAAEFTALYSRKQKSSFASLFKDTNKK
jgi:hypothetical protein